MRRPFPLRRTLLYAAGLVLWVLAGRYLMDRVRFYYQGHVFDQVYETGLWGRDGAGEGTSGIGSTEEVTREYRAFLEELIRKEEIRSVVDAGCGDWAFSQYIDWGGADYLGLDISSVVLERTRARFERPGLRFELGSVTDEMPKADLLIVKDVLMHLPNSDIQEFIRNNLRPERYRIAVLTHNRAPTPEENNRDIQPGEFRFLDLTAPPFNLQGLQEQDLFPRDATKFTQVLRLEDLAKTGLQIAE